MFVVDYLRLKKSFASCYKYSAVVRLYASESTAGTMDAAPLDVEDNIDGNQWYTSIQKLQETSLQALAAVRRFPGEKLVVRARQHPPPYCRWWLLAKLTPNKTARLMGRSCHGFEC